MTSPDKTSERQLGPTFERLKKRRIQLVAEMMMDMEIPLTEADVTDYLSTIDPNIQGFPFDNEVVSLPLEDTSFDWSELLDDDEVSSMAGLSEEESTGANGISTLRSRCLVLHVMHHIPLNRLSDSIQGGLMRDAVRLAGLHGFSLPPSWTAGMERESITNVFMSGHRNAAALSRKVPADISPDNRALKIMGKKFGSSNAHDLIQRMKDQVNAKLEEFGHKASQYLNHNPDPKQLVSEIVDEEKLRQLFIKATER